MPPSTWIDVSQTETALSAAKDFAAAAAMKAWGSPDATHHADQSARDRDKLHAGVSVCERV